MLKEIVRKETLISLSFFVMGCAFTFFTQKTLMYDSNLGPVNGLADLTTRYSKIDFLQVFISNVIVLAVILYVGFFSGGIISFCVLFWNGVISSLVFLQFHEYYSLGETLYAFSWHGSIELPVFIIASNKSFRGLRFYNSLYHETFNLKLIPSLKEFSVLALALVFAAIIEVNL